MLDAPQNIPAALCSGPSPAHLPAAQVAKLLFGAQNGWVDIQTLSRKKQEVQALFLRQATRYCLGGGSSLPVETGEEILASIFYTLGLALKKAPTMEDAAGRLAAQELGCLFAEGGRLLDASLARARRLLRAARSSAVPVPHGVYHTLLQPHPAPGSIEGFLHLYDPLFNADDALELYDYPLGQMPAPGLHGGEYLLAYLENLLLETRVLRRFDSKDIHRVLENTRPGYGGLPIGMFEPVLLCALRCVMGGTDPLHLAPGPPPKEFWQHPKAALEKAAAKLCRRLGFGPDDPAAKYCHQTAQNTLPRLSAGLWDTRQP